MAFRWQARLVRFFIQMVICSFLSGCYFFNFFEKKHGAIDEGSESSNDVLGDDLGAKAGGRDLTALAEVYSKSATMPPAATRPDPDVVVRRLLRQFRGEGTTLARVIGEVESYRLLLGGASEDFSTAPADGYDATSVLALMKVAGQTCRALVAPNSWEHPGWSTILPAPATDTRGNLKFLVQRFIGVSTASIPEATIDKLETILNNSNTDGNLTDDDYVAACTAIVLDAEGMLL